MRIWSNAKFGEAATARLAEELAARGHELTWAAGSASVLDAGEPDPALRRADIAFGQPDAATCLAHAGLRWMEVTSAGYTRYDTAEFRETLRERGTRFTNMSGVFAEPCAQHVLAMMLAVARQLPAAMHDQFTTRGWKYFQRRADSRLLNGQTVLFLGYGAIARRLAELLGPLRMRLIAVRRRAISERGVHIVGEERVTSVLGEADHVVNALPDNDATRAYVNSRRLAACKPGAVFYNIGRGTTVDQEALRQALESGRLRAAYLDVTDPEPLPPSHPLWTTPNCHITPHTGGGRSDQDEAIVAHFLENLRRFEAGEELVDRVE